MLRPEVRLARSLILGLGVMVGVVGCEEEFSDEPFGTLDLAPVYDGSPSNPGVPDEINATRGFLGGAAAEYYDFGVVPTIIDPVDFQPIAVRVQPMYFFFDPAGAPLFSRPVRELRDGTDWILGGKDVLNPNPKDFCVGATDMAACTAANEAQRLKPYPLRQRDPLGDPERGGVDDYQRPIIDLTPQDNEPPRREYTGLWEIVEIIAPAGYEPDSIKQVSTLDRAVASGKFRKRATGKVINCPIVDARTYVNSGITARRVLRPRIELWYRRHKAVCFLANGWETLGLPDGTRWFAGQDNERLDTFDVARVTVGNTPGATPELVVPVGRAFEPVRTTAEGAGLGLSRVTGNVITESQPRRGPNDPRGYTPMRWMFDVPAPPDFIRGGWKSIEDVDPSKASSRGSLLAPEVRNIPLRGVALPCSFEPNYDTTDPFRPGARLKQCGRKITEPGKPTRFDPLGDPVCNAERDPFNPNDKPLECNKDTCFCDAPVVNYGEACGPGRARCNTEPNSFAPEGYRCFPPWGGFCQRACNTGGNSRALENVGKEPKDWVDSRCGGSKGFVCLESLETCIKFCDQNIRDPKQCGVNFMVGMENRDIQEGQTCQDFGIAVCAWPDSFTPRPFTIP